MSKKIISQNKSDFIIIAIIIGLTAAIVVGIWFLSGAGTRTDNQSYTAKESYSNADDHSNHNHGGESANSTQSSNVSLASLVNKLAPDFTLTDKNNRAYSRNNLKGKNVILFFNEGLMCYPACWEQIVQLSSDNRLNSKDTVALSVVVDSAADWQKAIAKMPALANATVVFDTSTEMSAKFGALTTQSSMHYGSLPGHTYVVIDKESIVRHVYDDPTMSLYNEQLVAELAKLKK